MLHDDWGPALDMPQPARNSSAGKASNAFLSAHVTVRLCAMRPHCLHNMPDMPVVLLDQGKSLDHAPLDLDLRHLSLNSPAHTCVPLERILFTWCASPSRNCRTREKCKFPSCFTSCLFMAQFLASCCPQKT